MPSINPYLNFAGNTEEAFKFYQSVFGGDLNIMRFGDTPAGANVPPTVKDKVMHASLPIGKDNILLMLVKKWALILNRATTIMYV